VVLALTGIPWRTAWKYTERGYRHLFWDSGMILANVLALAPSGFASIAVPAIAAAMRRANRKDLRTLKAILEGSDT
jgi:hypothetical protein